MSDRSVALAIFVPLFCGIGFSFARLATAHTHVPRDEDYVAASAALRADMDPTLDAVAVLPPWSLRPYSHIGDLNPISGDALSKRPLHRHRRLYVLVEPDPSDELDALRARLGPPQSRRAYGRVEIWRWDLHEPPVAYDFTARLSEAQARIVVQGGEPVPCDVARPDGWGCRGRPDHQRLARMWLLVSENADQAVWSHPPRPGERMEASFANVPLGDAIVVRAGHTRDGADRAKGPVRVHVSIDGEEIAVLSRAPVFDFKSEVVDTKRFAGRTGTVTIGVDCDDDGLQHFAWDAYAIGAAP